MRLNFDIGNLIFKFVVISLVFFIIFPIIVIVIISFSSSGFHFPPSGLTLEWYIEAIKYRPFIRGMNVSFVLALISSGIATIIGTMVSIALVRYDFRGKNLINMFFMSPLMIPVVIMGLSLFIFLSSFGLLGGMFPLIIGHTLFTTPFSIRAVSASLQKFDRTLEEAAMNIGANPIKTFFLITLPIIKMGIISGMMLCFIVSWNNYSLSVFLVGTRAVPLPILLFEYIKFQWDPTSTALASIIILLSSLLIILIDRIIGLSVVMGVKTENY